MGFHDSVILGTEDAQPPVCRRWLLLWAGILFFSQGFDSCGPGTGACPTVSG